MKNLILTILYVLCIQNIYGQKSNPIQLYNFKSALGTFKTPRNSFNTLAIEGALHFNSLLKKESSLNFGILRSQKKTNKSSFNAFYIGYNRYLNLFNTKEISKIKHLLQLGVQYFESYERRIVKEEDNNSTYNEGLVLATVSFPIYYIARFDLSKKLGLSMNIGGELYLENNYYFNVGIGLHFR